MSCRGHVVNYVSTGGKVIFVLAPVAIKKTPNELAKPSRVRVCVCVGSGQRVFGLGRVRSGVKSAGWGGGCRRSRGEVWDRVEWAAG